MRGARLGEDLAHLQAGLPEPLEFEGGLHQHARQTLRLRGPARHGLTVVLREHGLRIEGIDMTEAAIEARIFISD